MANDHPTTNRIAQHLRDYIHRVARMEPAEQEAELAAQIARLQARDRNRSPVTP